jgi:hypothetical protein
VSSPQPLQTNGPAAATVLATGIGCFAFGMLTIAEHTVLLARRTFTFYGPVGSHSGTTVMAVLIWIVAWCVLHEQWRRLQVPFARVFWLSLALIAIGCIGTFPPTYEAIDAILAAAFGIEAS